MMKSNLIKFVELFRDKETGEHKKLIKEIRIRGNVVSSLKLQRELKIH